MNGHRGPRPDLPALFQVVLAQYGLSPHGTHGVHHWGRVLENARLLAELTGADRSVLECFALFHDACRWSEGRDPDHGPRGATLAWRFRTSLGLDDARVALLVEACECHTRGPRRQADLTVLACLDADRLDISRVGVKVNPDLLFTQAGRTPRIVQWAGERGSRRIIPGVCAGELAWPGPVSPGNARRPGLP